MPAASVIVYMWLLFELDFVDASWSWKPVRVREQMLESKWIKKGGCQQNHSAEDRDDVQICKCKVIIGGAALSFYQ